MKYHALGLELDLAVRNQPTSKRDVVIRWGILRLGALFAFLLACYKEGVKGEHWFDPPALSFLARLLYYGVTSAPLFGVVMGVFLYNMSDEGRYLPVVAVRRCKRDRE